MSHDGRRLERFREGLPRERGKVVPARSLSIAVGWEPARWRALERDAQWTSAQRAQVASGVADVMALLEVDQHAIDVAVAFVERASGSLPALAPATWRDRRGPALPQGRKLGTRLADGPDGRKHAIQREEPTPHEIDARAASVVPDSALEPLGRRWARRGTVLLVAR